MVRWISVDPGDTTGWALWDDLDLVGAGQTPNWEFVDNVWDGVFDSPPDVAVTPTEEDFIYAAGLIDGEAWIGTPERRGKPSAQLTVAMTTPAPLEWARDRFGGSLKRYEPRAENHQPQWRWSVQKQAELQYLLRGVRPYLKVKAPAATAALDLLAHAKFDKRTGRLGRMVVEDFTIYPWKAKDLAWDPVMTARVIGALMYIARVRNIDFVLQPAKIKETAVAGGAEDLFFSPRHENRHQNDAIMHAVFYQQTELLNPSNARVQDGRLVPYDPR